MAGPRAVPPRTEVPLHAAGASRSASMQRGVRNRGRMAAGVALLAASALLAVLVYGNLGERTGVLVAATRVDAGDVIDDADVRVVRLAADQGLATLPASRRAAIVGRRAAVGLVPGALISDASVAEGPTLPSGTVVIGAVLRPGQYPIGLRQGDQVLVLVDASDEAGRDDRSVDAVIVSVSTRSGPEGTAVALAVPKASAPSLARAGAAGRLLIVQPAS